MAMRIVPIRNSEEEEEMRSLALPVMAQDVNLPVGTSTVVLMGRTHQP